MKVNCVIVTFNRLELLKECLAAVEGQSRPADRIIIVDNCSTDGTENFLRPLTDNPQYLILRTDHNMGGAGGFSKGLKESIIDGADFTWMMDDDTIPMPNALEALLQTALAADNVGFVCSHVVWTDGNTHPRNTPGGILKGEKMYIKTSDSGTARRCKVCTFVSVMVSTQAERRVGLPVKEFFIWFDDIEYTLRITEAGFHNFYVEKSVVIHKTPDVFNPTIEDAPVSMAGRFYYQMRNTCYFLHRKHPNPFIFHLHAWNKLRIMKHRIKRRQDGQFTDFLDAVERGYRDGLSFFPIIEFAPENQLQQPTKDCNQFP